MLTFNNDTQFKKDLVKEIVWHRKQDAIAQGTYGTQNGHWKGCAVGCSLRSYAKIKGLELQEEYSNHKDFETYCIWPEWLAQLEDTIFEGLPKADAMLWPEQLAGAVPVGVDITPVKWKFCAFLLKENIERVLLLDITDSLKTQVVDVIRGVLNVHETAITTGQWDESAAEYAAWSAESAARSAARSAEYAARSAARSAEYAARSAARSAEYAARSAARSAAWSAAWSAAYQKYAKELVRLLKEVK